jgi:hypothetical protein
MFRVNKRSRYFVAIALAALGITAAPGRAVETDTALRSADDSVKVVLDTLPADSIITPPSTCDTAVADTTLPDSVNLVPTLYRPGSDTVLMAVYYNRTGATGKKRSPTLTLFKSVVFPGWGQFSNHKYIKAGLVFVVESYFIYKAVYYADKAADWRAKWKAAPEDQKYLYFNQYADYRDTRNSFLWYTALTVFLSMFDAYVDAHLANFPKDIPGADNVSLDFDPGRESRLTLSYHF